MAIDIRAEVSCSLGTVISGSFADDYLQGNGLIKTRGEVVLDGTQTPVVGTEVTFTYNKGGSTYTIPRVLRVLSSFADPFRRTTTVQLGCKLTYLENRKPPVTDPNAKDEHSDVPCSVFLKAMLPISAEYVFQQCLDALELDSAAIPLTNKFSLEEFDLTPGFMQVMSDLLQSEGYVGYLDSSETLRFLDLSQDSASGPVITAGDIVDLGPIGVGDLPGESVVVSYSSLRLKSPEDLFDDQYLKRNWEVEETYGPETTVSIEYNDTTLTDVFYPYQASFTRYDVWDRKIESVSVTFSSSAEVNGRWSADAYAHALENPMITASFPEDVWNIPVQRLTHELIEYLVPADAANNINMLKNLQGFRPIDPMQGIRFVKSAMQDTASEDNGSAALCKEEPPGNSDIIKSQVTTTYFSEIELAGSLNLDSYRKETVFAAFNAAAVEMDSRTEIQYETDESSGISKTITKRYLSRSQTVSGQQDLATAVQVADFTNLEAGIEAMLDDARVVAYVGAEINLHTQREYGLQKRPSETERANSANQKPEVTEQRAEIAWVAGSTTSTAVTEFSVPYAPDDEITWSEAGGFNVVPSDAKEKALRYGRIQNKLLLGNRSGVSLQLAPERLPKRPFDPLYLQASGITCAYRVNGTSWAFDANGIVASTDALLWGAVSAASGTNLASSWVPLAPGTTSLPLPYTPTGGTPDPETGASFGAVITPTTVLPPYIESVLVEGVSRSSAAITEYPYGLNRGSEAVVLRTRAGFVAGSRLEAAVGAFAMTGQVAGYRYTRKLNAAAGDVGATGYGAGSIRDYRIGTNYGTFMATGQNAIVALERAPLAAGAGSFALSGQVAQFSGATQFPADAGSFAVTGQVAGGIRTYVISGAAGSLSLAGQAVALNKTVPVVLLLHMDGANNSTTFTDSSSYGRTVTPAGSTSAYITTAQSKFGGASGYFVNAPYLQIADATELHFGGSNFTVEAWVRLAQTVGSTLKVIAAQVASSTSNHAWSFYYNAGTTKSLNFRYSTDGTSVTTFTSNTTLSTNTWYHVAAVRNGADLVLYVNGTQVGSTHNIGSDVIYNSTADLTVGASNTTAANFWYGYIDEMRISAVAQYTANFTAPTAAFPDP